MLRDAKPFYQIIDVPKLSDKRGSLSVIEQWNEVPFEIKRAFWIYDVPGGQKRGGHAYRQQEEFIVALSGSFDVYLFNGQEEDVVQLNRSYYGLYIPRLVWREMSNFSTNAVALVLSSTIYNEGDYIRDKQWFVTTIRNARQ